MRIHFKKQEIFLLMVKQNKMKKTGILIAIIVATMLIRCNTEKSKLQTPFQKLNHTEKKTNTFTKYLKPFKTELPTIGLLMYNGVLQSEVIATSDVFAKSNEEGKQIFNVISIAETNSPITTEEGIRILPDYNFANCPKLTALFIPSAYDMSVQIQNVNLLDFIKEKNKETKYMVSNCAGAQLIGKSGIANGYKIVTWIGGGEQLKKDYPNLRVQNDSLVSFVEDGKFSSSNGNLLSYISALNLLEKMSNLKHRNYVESYLYLNQLQNLEK